MATLTRDSGSQLARQARELFVGRIEGVLPDLGQAVQARLGQLVDQVGSSREMQDRRDAMMEYQKLGAAWVDGVRKAWRKALAPPTATARVRLDNANFELIGDDVVEAKILSSRLALGVLVRVLRFVWHERDYGVGRTRYSNGRRDTTPRGYGRRGRRVTSVFMRRSCSALPRGDASAMR